MALIAPQNAPAAGLANVNFVAATAADTAATGAGLFLLIRNTDAAAKTFTVTTPGTVDGIAIDNPQVVVPVSVAPCSVAVIPLIGRLYGSIASWAVTPNVTGVTVAVVKLAK